MKKDDLDHGYSYEEDGRLLIFLARHFPWVWEGYGGRFEPKLIEVTREEPMLEEGD